MSSLIDYFSSINWFDEFYYHQGLTYSEAFAFRYVCTTCIFGLMGITAAFCFGVSSILVKKTAKNAAKKTNKINSVDGGLYFNINSSYNDARSFLKEDQANQKATFWQIFLQVIAFISAWYAFFCIAIAPSILSGLGVIPVWSSVIITLLLFAIMYMIHIFWFCPNFLRKARSEPNSNANTLWRKVSLTTRLYKWRFAVFFALALVYSIAVPLLTAGTCMDFADEGYRYGSKWDTFGLSTTASRYFKIDTVCKSGQICHLYATLPEDSARGVILNVHTGVDVDTITIGYGVQSSEKQEITTNITAQSFYVDLEERGARYVHSGVLTGLDPNKAYYFEIYFNSKMQRSGTYLTLPSHEMERDLYIAAGGDVGIQLSSHEMTAVLQQHSPDAILVGGDLSYDNGMPTCYYSMDVFLRMFESLNEKFGRVIPLFTSVGNHDVGFNALQNAKIDITKNLYYTYFPQQTKSSGTQVPEIHERTSYYYYTLGNTVHLSLDSGFMVGYKGIQEEFIKNISETYPDHLKMANYHVPMHPACFPDARYSYEVLTEPAQYWAPLFEKYKFVSVFENHVHLYKKTYPIANDTVVPEGQGVVYFGDGNWGINPNHCLASGNWNATGLLEVFSAENHIWMLNITKDFVSHYAINLEGKIFDKVYTMNVSNYK